MKGWGYSLVHESSKIFLLLCISRVALSRILLQGTDGISIWILQLYTLTSDTKKCILSGDFFLSMIFPLNGPKHFPFGICMWAKSPALRNSGGRCASSFCIWEGLPIMNIKMENLFPVYLRVQLNYSVSETNFCWILEIMYPNVCKKYSEHSG